MGEGFGIPTVEAQSCGCPVIGGDWTATGELVFSGWKIPKSETVPMWTALGTNQYHVKPGAVADALELAYDMRGNQNYRQRARAGALAYDADKIAEKYWRPYLDKLAQELVK
jgi:glycosyltransferase involved in cell wall biosynthesis